MAKKSKSKEPVITVERRVVKYWNDKLAKDWYRLDAYVFEDGELLDGMPVEVANGDSDWARRETRHYGISVQEED